MPRNSKRQHQCLGLGSLSKKEFKLTEATLLRSYMAHLQSLAREMSAFYFEVMYHADTTLRDINSLMKKAQESKVKRCYEELAADLRELFPCEVHPVSFAELAKRGSFDRAPIGGRDPYRISLKVLKQRADRYRSRGHPDFKLLKGAVLKKKDDNLD